jgi:glycosyltransferase involved in cell wall biosynthesis
LLERAGRLEAIEVDRDLAAALAARRRPNVAVYWHVHTVLPRHPRAMLAGALKFATAGRMVDRILCPSINIAEAVARRFGPSAKIEVFPSPIDVAAYPTLDAEQRAEAREEMGVPDGARCVLHFGRAWRLKGGDIFVAAMAELARDGRRVFGLANQGGDDGRRDVRRSEMEDVVSVVGPVPDIHKLYGAADVFAAPSRGEGMPFSVIEALCSGVPVVASDLPGHRFIADEVDACVIAPREPRELAAAIGGFLDADPHQVAERCLAARGWIERNLDLDAATERLFADYEQTISARGLAPIG